MRCGPGGAAGRPCWGRCEPPPAARSLGHQPPGQPAPAAAAARPCRAPAWQEPGADPLARPGPDASTNCRCCTRATVTASRSGPAHPKQDLVAEPARRCRSRPDPGWAPSSRPRHNHQPQPPVRIRRGPDRLPARQTPAPAAPSACPVPFHQALPAPKWGQVSESTVLVRADIDD